MRYKTTIEIITDAENKSEAIDIVGEYLSGNNIVSGIDMKCATRPVNNYAKNSIAAFTALSLIAICAILLAAHLNPSQKIGSSCSGVNAVQPPLKTSAVLAGSTEFKREWEKTQTSEALNHIKRINR